MDGRLVQALGEVEKASGGGGFVAQVLMGSLESAQESAARLAAPLRATAWLLVVQNGPPIYAMCDVTTQR